MSTATYDRPLYAVPNPPDQQARMGLLLTLRRRARQALDTLLALPRGAASWVLRHLRTLLDGVGEHRLLGWASTLLRTATGLIRGIGIVPVAAAVLSTPEVWRATLRLARSAGSALLTFGRGIWARVKGLLAHGGTTGARVSQSLSRAGAALGGAARAVLAHPVAQPVLQTVQSLLGLVRPVSQGVVTHRLLGLLVPAVWLRVALELLALLLLLAPGLPATLRSRMAGQHHKEPVASTSGPAQPFKPTAAAAADTEADNTAFPMEWEQAAPARNRAERRAQQQEQARAKRARPHQ
jgi:hypothetical protein